MVHLLHENSGRYMSMGFLTEVYRQVKLTAAGIPDLDLEIFKHAGTFERAVILLIDQLDDDLHRLASKTEIAAATVLEFGRKEDRVKKILDANAFANRVDTILAHRCKQYVAIADLYKVTMLNEKERKRESNTKLYDYIEKLSNLTWQDMKDMLQRGEVPFRIN